MGMPRSPQSTVTIVIAPRERFSVALRSLENIYENTSGPFELVYVDGNAPGTVQRALREQSKLRGFTLVRCDRYLSPNQARNLGLAQVRTPYVAFVDNDVFVTKGWLDALVECAEETGAAVVGPLAFEGDPADEQVHNAGGFYRFTGTNGDRDLVQENRYGHRSLSEMPTDRGRFRVDYVEFHCVLVRRSVFELIGPLDEALLSTREHLDLCLRVADAGGEVWSETDARVTYDNPPPVRRQDLPYFLLRWSERWNHASLEHFAAKYGLSRSYVERATKSRVRRHVVFAPVPRAVTRLLGPRAGRMAYLALSRGEQFVNVAVAEPLIGRHAAVPR
jgi:glycosyltransferase involved in cell wall biosynthesis